MPEIDIDHAADHSLKPRFGRPAVLLVLAFVAAGVTGLAIPLIRGASDRTPARPLPVAAPARGTSPPVLPPGLGDKIGCLENPAKPHCHRYVTDLTRRTQLGKAEEAAAQTALERVEAVMPPGREGPCEYDDEDYDVCSVEILPPTTGQVRHALDKAGYRTAVIRSARADDPAPVDSLLLAVPIGTACVLSFDDGNGPQLWTAGQLPDGGCLAM